MVSILCAARTIAMRRSMSWRLVLPVPLVTIVAVLVAWLALPPYVARNAVDNAIATALQTGTQLKTLRAYYTANVAAKAIKSGALKPDFDHQGKDDRIPLPATVIHELSEQFKTDGTTIKLYSPYPFPNRAGRALDAFGTDAWTALSRDPKAVFTRREMVDGRDTVRV